MTDHANERQHLRAIADNLANCRKHWFFDNEARSVKGHRAVVYSWQYGKVPEQSDSPHILIVGDEPEIRAVLNFSPTRAGFRESEAESAESALQ